MRDIAILLLSVVLLAPGCEAPPGGVDVSFRLIGEDLRIPVTAARTVTAPMRFETEGAVRFLTTPMGEGTRRPTPKDGEDGGKATFEVRVPRAGAYTLYGRFFWHDQGATNSFWAKVGDSPYQRVGNDGPPGVWFYWKGPSWKLEAGKQTLTIREREWGARVAELFLSPVPDCVTRATRFEAGRFTSEQSQLLVDPPFSMEQKPSGFGVFHVSAGEKDIREGPDKLPLVIHGPGGRRLFSGALRADHQAIVSLPNPQAGEYVIQVGEAKQSWQWLLPRLARLEARIGQLKQTKKRSAEFDYWWPTLVLRHKNIQRGYRREHLSVTHIQSLSYVLAEFDRAEQVADALAKDDYRGLEGPGGDERAVHSDVDGELCPYVLYLPRAYFEKKSRFPLVLYLHGANGTQWEIDRSFEARDWKVEDIRWPVVVPFARGNSGYRDAAEKDIIQMIRQLVARYGFDENRLVVSGFSMGGGGTWRLVGDYPDMFEAAIPMAGGMPWHWFGGREKQKQLPKNLRTRIIIAHSPADKAVPMELAERARQHLAERGIAFKFISYPGGHVMYPGFLELINGLYE